MNNKAKQNKMMKKKLSFNQFCFDSFFFAFLIFVSIKFLAYLDRDVPFVRCISKDAMHFHEIFKSHEICRFGQQRNVCIFHVWAYELPCRRSKRFFSSLSFAESEEFKKGKRNLNGFRWLFGIFYGQQSSRCDAIYTWVEWLGLNYEDIGVVCTVELMHERELRLELNSKVSKTKEFAFSTYWIGKSYGKTFRPMVCVIPYLKLQRKRK